MTVPLGGGRAWNTDVRKVDGLDVRHPVDVVVYAGASVGESVLTRVSNDRSSDSCNRRYALGNVSLTDYVCSSGT